MEPRRILASNQIIPPVQSILRREEEGVLPVKTAEKVKPLELIEKAEDSKPQTQKPVNSMGDVEKSVVRSLFDSTFRGVIRYFENSIDSQPLRVLYRFGTESARKISEIAFVNGLDGKEVMSLNDFKNGSLRALEHVPATAIIEPGFYEGTIPRVLAGLGNITVRLASRFGLYKMNVTSPEALGEKHIMDEFASRSLLRAIPVNFDSPIAGIGMRTVEQLAIDLNLHVFKPFGRLFPQFAGFVDKSKASADPEIAQA